jgi:predicted phosphodiesterase
MERRQAPPLIPGRSCPADYRYGAGALAAPATLRFDSLWIAGGLYGNTFAMRRLEELFASEQGESALVFNGDFHWFDVAEEAFAEIERGVSMHSATRGNVETEIARPQAGAGCGCAYPEWVDDGDVARSNRIIERLKRTAQRTPGAAARLATLPMYRIAEVAGQRIAIVHGDADSLAGWGFSQEALATREGRETAIAALGAAGVQVFASSHTCLPVLQAFEGAGLIVNNGAAGMPNFADTQYGLATRISLVPHSKALYRTRLGPLHVEAIPIDYDAASWREAFLAQWPEGSDAHASYWRRITHGPRYLVDEAIRVKP